MMSVEIHLAIVPVIMPIRGAVLIRIGRRLMIPHLGKGLLARPLVHSSEHCYYVDPDRLFKRNRASKQYLEVM